MVVGGEGGGKGGATLINISVSIYYCKDLKGANEQSLFVPRAIEF